MISMRRQWFGDLERRHKIKHEMGLVLRNDMLTVRRNVRCILISDKVEKCALDLMKYGKYYSSISCTRALL